MGTCVERNSQDQRQPVERAASDDAPQNDDADKSDGPALQADRARPEKEEAREHVHERIDRVAEAGVKDITAVDGPGAGEPVYADEHVPRMRRARGRDGVARPALPAPWDVSRRSPVRFGTPA